MKRRICWTRLSMRLTDDGGSPAEPGRGCRNNLLLEHAWRAVPIANREAVLHLGGRNGHHAGMSESWSTSKACPGTHGLHDGPLVLVGLYPPVVATLLSTRQQRHRLTCHQQHAQGGYHPLRIVAHIIARRQCNQHAQSAPTWDAAMSIKGRTRCE